QSGGVLRGRRGPRRGLRGGPHPPAVKVATMQGNPVGRVVESGPSVTIRAPSGSTAPRAAHDMISSLAIREHPQVRSADIARWRALCLVALGAFLALGLSAFAVGILPGDLHLRTEFLTEDHSAAHTLAWWVNIAGTWRALLPLSLVIFAVSRTARRRWWLWVGVFLASGALEQVFK